MTRSIVFFFSILAACTTHAKTSIVDTVHNLSTSGPGQYKSDTVDQVCAFCHTPHRAATGAGLWNRSQPTSPSRGYQSSTSSVQQSDLSGSSLLCQSCHDGTIALGQMLNPPANARGKSRSLLGVTLRGRSRISSDLTNHHPIGFDYDGVARSSNAGLLNAAGLDLPLEQGRVQCTSCHDAHGTIYPPFLHKASNDGTLCLSCHELAGDNWTWRDSSHATATNEPSVGNPWPERKPEWAGRNVAENSCQNCHASHHAKQPQRLMVEKEEKLCLRCHDGTVASTNIRNELHKFSAHPTIVDSQGRHDAVREERRGLLQMHAECEDCHNPHASKPAPPMISTVQPGFGAARRSNAPYANDVIANVPGIDITGQYKDDIEFQYELCFRCHGEIGRSACGNRRCSTAEKLQMARQDNLYNLREKFDPSSAQLISWHPVVENDQTNNNEVPSLLTSSSLNAVNSLIYCTDCHNNDAASALGGSGPNGPHGSRHESILAFDYQLNPNSRFNASSDRLCFTCHDSNNLFSDASFQHRLHVLEEGSLCASCHDPHGSAVYPHLINFLVSAGANGNLAITGTAEYPDPTWIDEGRFKGRCYLSCHGVTHDGDQY